ncbi:alpha/beta hydrolase-fold protein [Pseudonocardia nematodicida]|uniref:Alpha/beta hydrolase-fold protein n=1 Tax=Pseudonocardia nematodicida TaxID=1206997 RepID=A0ABV1KF06_9PSEU
MLQGALRDVEAVPVTGWPFVLGYALAGVACLALVVLGVRRAGHARRRVWRVLARCAAVAVTLLVLLSDAVVGVNAGLDYLRTVGDVLGAGPVEGIGVAQLLLRRSVPADGVVARVPIPGSLSGFDARPAEVWVPPAWFTRPRPELPVVMLLHGTPGRPADWVDSGGAAATADAWARTHDGVAPVLVMPDINGDYLTDSECVDAPGAAVETYLTRDVPRVVTRLLDTRPPGRDWAVAGLSEGGTCAVMLALRHPDLFGTFGDYGGLIGPRTGDDNGGVDATVAGLFAGSVRRFDTHEPADLLRHRRYPELTGWFEAGGDDTAPAAAARTLSALATRAGIASTLRIVPGGGHDFDVFATALTDSFPTIAARVSGPPAEPDG